MNKMNFNKLRVIQEGLDNFIGETKDIDMGLHEKDRNVAMVVEFGEFLNEVPHVFKYWKKPKYNRELALEEYVDVLHFLLSIANDLGVEEYEYSKVEDKYTLDLVLEITTQMGTILQTKEFKPLMDNFLTLGYQVGFSEAEIEQNYLDKNEKNHQRQVNGY